MPDITPLPEFPRISVQYEPQKNPFFQAILIENLRKIKTVAVGKSLLSEIESARPKFRSDFPENTNIICRPREVSFIQAGKNVIKTNMADGSVKLEGMRDSANRAHSPAGCSFWRAGGSGNQAVDQKSAEDATGTVCYMYFTNIEVRTSKGEATAPYVVLAHELIHSLHCLQGIRLKKGASDKGEEDWTTGIGQYANNPMTENKFRLAFGMPLRIIY